MQAELDGAIIRRGKLGRCAHQDLAEAIAAGPALDAGDAIGGAHGFTIMPAQAIAQADFHQLAVTFHAMAFGHLRARLQRAIGAIERVKHAIAMRGDDGAGAEDWVQIGQGRLRHEAQRARAAGLGQSGARQGRGQGHGERGCKKCTALHTHILRFLSADAGKGALAQHAPAPAKGRKTRANGRCTVPYAGPNRVRFQGSRVKPASQPQKGSPRCLRP